MSHNAVVDTRLDAHNILEAKRWAGKPTCPYCGLAKSSPLAVERRHHCNACNATFSATVGTVFHQTHLPLDTWFQALHLMLRVGKPPSTRELARALGITKNTAWRVASAIRQALTDKEQRELLHALAENKNGN